MAFRGSHASQHRPPHFHRGGVMREEMNAAKAAPLPRGEYVAEIVEISVQAFADPNEQDIAAFLFQVCEGKYAGRRFWLSTEYVDSVGAPGFRNLWQAAGMDWEDRPGHEDIEEDIDYLLGRLVRISIWSMIEGRLPRLVSWGCMPVKAGEINLNPAPDPFSFFGPRGKFLAKVTDSHICDTDEAGKMLYLTLEVYTNRFWPENGFIGFHIHDKDEETERMAHICLCRIAQALGIDAFDDSEVLHDKEFVVTFWRPGGVNGNFSCEAAGAV